MLAHQYGGDLCQWVPYAKRLASMGYTALAFDLRGFGRSQKRYGDALIRYDRDVVAAAKLARGLGARKVILVGASLGANAVVAAGAAITPPVDGLVSLSAPGTFRQDAIAAAKKLSVPGAVRGRRRWTRAGSTRPTRSRCTPPTPARTSSS